MADPVSSFATRLAYGATQLPRVAWYLGHGAVMRRLSNAQRRSDETQPRAQPAPSRAGTRLYAEMAKLFRQDLANVEAGLYPLPADHDGSWPILLNHSRLFFSDLPAIQRRREKRGYREVRSADLRGRRPDYYLQNFHFQTGGWMTRDSAQRYDTPFEITGMEMSPDGSHVLGNWIFEGAVKVWPTDDFGSKTTLADRYDGHRLNSPNDLAFKSNGDLYFTDQGQSGIADPTGRVWRLRKNGELTKLLDNAPSPNGITLNKKNLHVYVAITRSQQIWRLPLMEGGTPSKTGVAIQLSGGHAGPDGIETDDEDGLLVCHLSVGIWRFDRNCLPTHLVHAGGEHRLMTNIAFRDKKARFIRQQPLRQRAMLCGNDRQTRGLRQSVAITRNRHRAVLEKSAAHPALGAAGNLATIYHQFIPGGRKETRGIAAVIGYARLSGIRGEYSTDSQTVVSQTESLRHSFVISVNRFSKTKGIVRDDRVGELVIV